jgi:uncharacterized membrane protein
MKLLFKLMLLAWSSYGINNAKGIDRETQIKQNAFIVLSSKCNTCHARQNPKMIFTELNMDKHARKINWQVFILKRMPKGDAVKLSEAERETLKRWLEEKH